MRKLIYAFVTLTTTLLAMGLTGCEGEKELIVIEGELPIKTSTLYMVGDATPNGWDIGNPTPFSATAEDALVFTWEGSLYKGEIKLCLTPGSWDVGFIRPEVAGAEITKTDIKDQKFVMYAGDPDNKWKVTDAGKYRLTFDLRNWTMSTVYLGENEAPVIVPIETDVLYVVGDATPAGWSIDAPFQVDRKSKYIFVFEGNLHVGELKACISTGDWGANFVRPTFSNCRIDKNGVESPDFIFAANPDNKWKVAEAGKYRLTFDLEHWKLKAEYLGEIVIVKDPIKSETLYMIGDATPGGWSMNDATALTRSATNQYLFTWDGLLVTGEMKACLQPDETFACPFIRPASSDVEISENGVTSPDFVYSTGPDDKWIVKKAGKYHIEFDLEHWTIKAVYKNGAEKEPIESETLYMIGDATPGGWSMDDATAFTRDTADPYLFAWEGVLKTGEMKACLKPDNTFSCPFLRPASPNVEISANGVASPDFVYTTSPDDKWLVKEAGTYRIEFNLKNWTIQVVKK